MFKTKETMFLIFMICCLALALLTGCSGEAESPADTVVLLMDSFIDYDLETAVSLLKSEDDFSDLIANLQEDVMIKAVFGQISYEEPKIVSEEGDKAIVSVKITAPNMVEIIDQTVEDVTVAAMETEAADENIDQMVMDQLLEIVTGSDYPLITNETKIELERVDGNWLILGNDELVDAITGNITK